MTLNYVIFYFSVDPKIEKAFRKKFKVNVISLITCHDLFIYLFVNLLLKKSTEPTTGP